MPFTYNAITFLRAAATPDRILRRAKTTDRIFTPLTFCCFLWLLYVL